MSRRGLPVARFLYGLGEGVRIGIDAIRANLFRSGLTILGVAVGVSVVVVMAALITGIRGSIQEGIEAAGPRTFWVTRMDLTDVQLVQQGRPEWWDRPPVTVEEARRVARLSGIQGTVVSLGLFDPNGEGGMTLDVNGTRMTGVRGIGESPAWPGHRRATFTRGRNFHPVEVEGAHPVMVVSEPLARDLFGEQDPLGRRVRVTGGPGGSLPFTIIGVVETEKMLFDEDVPQFAVMPYTTALRRMKVPHQGGDIVVLPRDDVPLTEAEDQVISLLRTLRGLAPGEPNNFSIVRSTQLMEIFDRFTAVFFVVMLALSSVGLMVGGVGVVGIMLISVTERTREIGIRKSVGATNKEILWQFLVEAAVLTVAGGAVGLLIGAGGAWLTATFSPIPASIPLWSVAAALAMAAITGMLFGLVPAVRAARMEPVAALRYE